MADMSCLQKSMQVNVRVTCCNTYNTTTNFSPNLLNWLKGLSLPSTLCRKLVLTPRYYHSCIYQTIYCICILGSLCSCFLPTKTGNTIVVRGSTGSSHSHLWLWPVNTWDSVVFLLLPMVMYVLFRPSKIPSQVPSCNFNYGLETSIVNWGEQNSKQNNWETTLNYFIPDVMDE